MATRDDSWKLTVVPDVDALSATAANIVGANLQQDPDLVFTLPTGTTPLQLFDELARRTARGEIDFSRAEFFSLDDYLGLSGDEPNSLTAWLRERLLSRINLAPERTHLVPAGAADPAVAAQVYDRELAASGGFELAVLGVGANGHIAFNEPGTPAEARTRIVGLTPETIAQAAAYWDHQWPIPAQAMTVGIANLLDARRIVLLASGEGKAEALKRALQGDISSESPASYLRLAGPRLEVIADQEAASRLTRFGTIES